MTVVDALTCVLVVFGIIVLATGGVRLYGWGIRISATSAWRPFAAALGLAVLRHALYRRRSLPHRVADFAVWTASTCRQISARRLLGDLQTLPFERPAGTVRIARGEVAAVATVMVALTVVMTYPQAVQLNGVHDWGDPVFSIWRLAWIAHQLVRDPLHLFDANIMYPARDTLAFSDPLLLPNVLAAPFAWLGVRPALLHTLLLLASFAASGLCMYLVVRSITGRVSAAVVAAVAFAFYPYRFDQYAHFEQQFSFWMPLALWALYRLVTRRRFTDGLLAGALVAAQYLSGLYLGVFFALWLVPVCLVFVAYTRALRAIALPLVAGVMFAAVLLGPTVVPQLAARQAIGERTLDSTRAFSAQPSDYLTASSDRLLYRSTLGQTRHLPERDLFPGLVVVLLALVALWPPLSGIRLAAALGLLVAFEASLGTNGFLFPLLFKTFVPFRAFRVPARFSMLVGLSLSLLAGYGSARIASRVRRWPLRLALTAVFTAAIMCECWSAREFERVPWTTDHPLYQWLASRSPSPIVNLPLPEPGADLWNPECRYMYASISHWQPMVNGYSGAWPSSYYALRDMLMTFPDDRSVRALREQRIRYVVIHEAYLGRPRYAALTTAASARTDLKEVFRTGGGAAHARIYEVQEP